MSLPTQFQNYMHLSKYARWKPEEVRRELWPETAARYFDFFVPYLIDKHGLRMSGDDAAYLQAAVRDQKVMPSMRALATAGPALARDHVCTYNCAYVPIDDFRAFSEILYILACTAGVGYSVERQFINKLPTVPDNLDDSQTVIQVRDSKRGWAEALNELFALLYSGRIPQWDVSKVRGAGEILKTMGGRASGPEPLVELFKFIIYIFMEARGRKLNSQECHDIACKVGDTIIVGGVRRAALISLSNLSDQRMRDAKAGQWWELAPWRALANNSTAYTERPEVGQFMREWMSLYESKSGERGIFNREAARAKVMHRGARRGYWDDAQEKPIDFGLNPCGEIILRPMEFCNLSSAVARADDSVEDLEEKVRIASIFGTWQSCLTNFRHLRKKWRDNCEEERLLGVSINGIMDCPLLNGRGTSTAELADLCEHLREIAIGTNGEWAERLGITPAAAVTCVKPEGNSSQFVNSASGLHARFAQQYVRRVRQDNMDPLTRFMIDVGFPHEADVMKPDHQTVFEFPVHAPEGAVLGSDITAIEQLEHWKLIREHWCDHNPSVTVTVREHEWPEVGSWVWNNFDSAAGLTFLPESGHTYRQAPYEAVSAEKLAELEERMPADVDWSQLADYEREDHTGSTREMACTSGACEIA